MKTNKKENVNKNYGKRIERIWLDKNLATELLKSQKKNRPLNKRHLYQLQQTMIKGEFILSNDAICMDWNGHMINGQHRCAAVVQCCVPIEVYISYGHDPNDIYTMDHQLKKRTIAEAFALEGVKYSNLLQGSLNVMKEYIEKIYMNGYTQKTLTVKTAFKEYEAHKPGLNNSCQYIEKLYGKNLKLLMPSLGVFFHYAFSIVDLEKANNFMTMIYEGSMIMPGTLVAQLRNKLIRNQQSVAKLHRSDIMIIIIKTWNDYYLDKNLKHLLLKPQEGCPKIAGKPFHGMYSEKYPMGYDEERFHNPNDS